MKREFIKGLLPDIGDDVLKQINLHSNMGRLRLYLVTISAPATLSLSI